MMGLLHNTFLGVVRIKQAFKNVAESISIQSDDRWYYSSLCLFFSISPNTSYNKVEASGEISF